MIGASTYRDRGHAGQVLAERLGAYAGRSDIIVLGLPRGGVPVARTVAEALGATMDVLLVRKLGVPGQEELALGAIASVGGRIATVYNEQIVGTLGLTQDVIDDVIQREGDELKRRERLYRPGRALDGEATHVAERIHESVLIVIDDGLATGATMRAAISALRQLEPVKIVVAVPVAPADTVRTLSREVDELICPLTPEFFGGVGQWYEDFAQVTDEEVREMLPSVPR